MAKRKKAVKAKVKKHGKYEYTDFKLNVRHTDKKQLLRAYLGLLISNYEGEGQRLLTTVSEAIGNGPQHAEIAMDALDEYLLYLEEYREGLEQLRNIAREQFVGTDQALKVKVKKNEPMSGDDFAKRIKEGQKNTAKKKKKVQEATVRGLQRAQAAAEKLETPEAGGKKGKE
tara:strand:+ start:1120 stop:1635 length:516 start_codon:yes stop_codon:yes gene_type:complete